MQSAIPIMYQERLLSTRPTSAGIGLVPLAEPLLAGFFHCEVTLSPLSPPCTLRKKATRPGLPC